MPLAEPGRPLPDADRPRRLLAALDARYLDFLLTLPEPLRALGRERRSFSGVTGDCEAMAFSAMNPGITCTPWLFWEWTRDLADDVFLDLAEAGACVVLASVLRDHLCDGQAPNRGAAARLHAALRRRGRSVFRRHFLTDSPFWSAFVRLNEEHRLGLRLEARARADPQQFTWEWFQVMVQAKFAPIVLTVAAFLTWLDLPERLPPIERSIKDLAVAAQLLDDLGDWREDLASGRLTYFLSRLAPPERWAERPWPSPAEIQQAIDASWEDLEHLDLIEAWLAKALDAVDGIVCPAWKAYLDGYRSLAQQHATRLGARHLLEAIRPLVAPRAH